MVRKNCPLCNRSFLTNNRNKTYCSKQCRGNNKSIKIVLLERQSYPLAPTKAKICKYCNNTFNPFEHGQLYCCKNCRIASDNEKKRRVKENDQIENPKRVLSQ